MFFLNFHRISLRKRVFIRNSSTSHYCLDLVKKNDYENFLCTILLKNAESRGHALAVRAFNVEIARVAEQVSQVLTGKMRLQFWEDAVQACYAPSGPIPEHPVVWELKKMVKKVKPSKRHLLGLISARKLQFNVNSFRNLDDLEKYSEQTVSAIFYLILEASLVKNLHADHGASHLGKAQGIAQSIKSLPFAQKINFVALPQELLAKYKVSQEEIVRKISSQKLNDCIFEVASRSHQHLTKTKTCLETIAPSAKPIFLSTIFLEDFLMRLQKVDYDPFNKKLTQKNWFLLPKLWLQSLK